MLADLVDLEAQLRSDHATAEAERHRRDRAIGQQIPNQTDRLTRLKYWLDAVAQNRAQLPGRNAVRAQRLIGIAVVLLGLLAGWGTALALFDYDGTHPVNIINILAVFVFAQLLLLLLFCYVTLPDKLLRHLPGARGLQGLLHTLSPGHLQRLLARVLPQRYRDALAITIGQANVHRVIFARVHKWITLVLSQKFALAFNVGALAGCLFLIVFSDLAFGWSTTMDLDSGWLHRTINTLTWPWADWLPAAAPSQELIETSHYFRFKQGQLIGATPGLNDDAALLGGWWPFLVMNIVVYGLLPRLLALLLCRWRLAAALRSCMLRMPGVTQLLRRMSQALVETKATTPEVKGAMAPAPVVNKQKSKSDATQACVVNWGGIALSRTKTLELIGEKLGLEAQELLYAGGNASLEDDDKVVRAIKKARADRAIVVLVKSWEPPLLEFLDFVEDLRQAVGVNRPIAVVPMAFDAESHYTAPSDQDIDTWRNKLQTLGDPWVELQSVLL